MQVQSEAGMLMQQLNELKGEVRALLG